MLTQAHTTLCEFCLAFLIWRLRTGRRRVKKGSLQCLQAEEERRDEGPFVSLG